MYHKSLIKNLDFGLGGDQDGRVETLNVPMDMPELQLFTEQVSVKTTWRITEKIPHK